MGEKTEKASSKRKSDERKKGNVFTSNEINILLSLLAVVFTLKALAEFILSVITQGINRFWTAAASPPNYTPDNIRALFVQSSIMFAACAIVPLLVAGLCAVAATMAQTRGLFSGEKIKPKFSNMSPLKGLKKIFSLRGLVELFKSMLKITVLGYVIYNKFQERFMELPRLMEMEFMQSVFYTGGFLMDIVVSVAVMFAFLAVADYLYQRWQYEKDMRMSKQELKEEYKQLEGDPQIKGKIRQKQREMATGRMMQNVPEADVVIRNPTHYAVAIRYEAGETRAPVVVAKGMDLLALRIVKVAEQAGVTIVENRPLARGLHDGVPLDREIPEEFFQPVAEVLAFVYETAKRYKLPKHLQDGQPGKPH